MLNDIELSYKSNIIMNEFLSAFEKGRKENLIKNIEKKKDFLKRVRHKNETNEDDSYDQP